MFIYSNQTQQIGLMHLPHKRATPRAKLEIETGIIKSEHRDMYEQPAQLSA